MNEQSQKVLIKYMIDLSQYIDHKVSKSKHHSSKVAHLAKSTGRNLSMDDRSLRTLYWAALLHDIGKIGIPEEVLSKAGPLSEDEWKLMKLHPTVGANIVKKMRALNAIAPVIQSHQEKYDGSGYPAGLVGDQIPQSARILTVVDAFEAMTSERVYRHAYSHQEAVDELQDKSGSHFDPLVVRAFLEMVNTPITL
ncbi:MAG: HD-GYP domain-containing protein [Anaerolineales bacterium]|nr:HD-GYP domain-containing protein [Anaerolineales bacterium]